MLLEVQVFSWSFFSMTNSVIARFLWPPAIRSSLSSVLKDYVIDTRYMCVALSMQSEDFFQKFIISLEAYIEHE